MAERYAPPSPTKLPAYRLPTLEAQRPPSPPTGLDLFEGDLIAPMGCELSVHNVSPTESLPTSADVINQALLAIHKNNPMLTPVTATFKLKDTPTLCTIKLRNDAAIMDVKPRPDLLQPWIDLLREYNLEWEVNWACAPANRDKRLWVVLKGVDGAIDRGTVEVARQELQRLGFRSVGGFVMSSSGSVVINMASLQLARSLRNKKSLKIPKLARHPLMIDSFPIVEPEWAYELIVTGLDNYDASVKSILDDYFSKKYRDNDGQTLWYRSRIVDDAYYCFMMRDWDATLQVLQDKDKFEAKCGSTLPNLGYPRQIYEVNAAGGFHESIARKLKLAGASVSNNLSDVHTQIQNLRRDVDRGFEQMDKRIEAQQKDLRTLTNSVSTLNDRVQSQSYSLLALQDSSVLQERKAAIDGALLHKSILFNMMSDEEKEQTKIEAKKLELMRQEVNKEMEELRTAARGFAAPSLPPPPTVRNTAPAMSAQPQQRQPIPHPPSQPSPVKEAATKRPVTRSSQPGAQNSANSGTQSVANSSIPAKRRKTTETQAVPPQEAPLADEDCEMVPETQKQVSIPSGPTRIHTETPLRQVTFAPVTKVETSELLCVGTHACSDVVTCRRGILHCLFLVIRIFARLLKISLGSSCFLLILTLCLLAHSGEAMPNSRFNGLSFYALNANGMVNEGKLSQISGTLRIRRPHILTISETKTSDKVGSKLGTDDYNFFEETGIKMENHHLYKWGVVVGIRKDIQVAQRLQVAKALEGRVVALDLVIGTDAGKGFIHRYIGVYAPWNPGPENNETSFWNEVAKLCNDAAFSWSLAGDLNATVSATERASGGTDAKRHFLNFLDKTKGFDLWSRLKPERSRLHDWTCKAHTNRTSMGNIIDRVVISTNCASEADIAIADKPYDFIQMTDHRAVIATLFMKKPENTNGTSSVPIDLDGEFHHPRVRYPSKKDKIKFDVFRQRVDDRIKAEDVAQRPVTCDVSFLHRYDELTDIIVSTAKDVFGITRKVNFNDKKVSSPSIRRLERKLRNAGGALNLERRGHLALVSEESRLEFLRMRHDYEQDILCSSTQRAITLREFILKRKRMIYKELYHERMNEIITRAKTRDRQKISYALRVGSTKRLVNSGEYIGLPTAVNSHLVPGEIVTDAEGVKTATCDYLKDLYNREEPPVIAKPWMTTPSVVEVRRRVEEKPFEWPRRASLADFRAMLRRGNQRPSPGPDRWEKWCVKALSDDALQLVLDLHNYEVINASFPGKVKDMTCTMFHKRNIRTDLSNWRGIMLSNFIANSPMTWLTNLLTTYSSSLNIVPETQVATQQGVQTRDVISYLSAVKCYAQRNNMPLLALQRDQMKGFDYLAPQGFYDAIEAYGLPPAIADLDRAAQSMTKVHIRTAYGLAGPITVDAVTKQGGPASPLKSVLTTSLGHRYLDDIAKKENGTLVIATEARLKGQAPHLPDHSLQAQVTMIEATDDSIIFARDVETLQKFTLAMERFQFAYGWLTSWKKTVAYGICLPEGQHLPSVRMPSVTPTEDASHYNEEKITWHEVPLRLGEIQFLRTQVDDTAGRFSELQDFIKNFRFPRFSIQTPITLARKIISQNIVSKCRAMLSLQPIKQSDAELLDKMISAKIHELLRFPFCPQTNILTLPLSHHGLDFPSIARVNAGIAAEGMMRDLNHHIRAYRLVARITHAEWMCRYNNCGQVTDGPGTQRKFTHLYGKIPATWLIAHSILSSTEPVLNLRLTDVSFILDGEVSILHVMNICKARNLQILDGTAVNCLTRVGITMLRHLGTWRRGHGGRLCFEVKEKRIVSTTRWTTATDKSWDKAAQLLMNVPLDWLCHGEEDLLTPRDKRRKEVENRIRILAHLLKIPPSTHSNSDSAEGCAWASDGSMVPATAGIMDEKSVTAALTGPITMVMKLIGRNTSILHGEIFGLIMGHILSNSRDGNSRLYTDHLNSVRFLQDSHTSIEQERSLRYRNGRSYLRWLSLLSEEAGLQVNYTKGHSNDDTLESKLNSDADHFAVAAQKQVHSVPPAPAPTFTMNDFTYHRQSDGWIESNVRVFIDQLLIQRTAADLSHGCRQRMATWLYHKPNPPPFVYHKATSAYTAAVQLYARSGQLATAEKVEERQACGVGKCCRLGCAEVEDEHHIFVLCPAFSDWREDSGRTLRKMVEERLSKMDIDNVVKDTVLTKAEFFYADDPTLWPLKESCFYLGHVPKLSNLLPQTLNGTGPSRLSWERTIHGIYCDWHNTSVRLASRIFGDLQRRVTRTWDQERNGRSY